MRIEFIGNPLETRPVRGFEGLYSVSADGQVWSHARKVVSKAGWQRSTGLRQLKRIENHHGYWYVNLYTHAGKQVRMFVHRLVAMAWLPAPAEGRDQVNHIDGDRKNANVENLEWCTCSENHRHAYRSGLRSVPLATIERMKALGRAQRRLTDEQIAEARTLHANGSSLAKIAALMGCHRATIHNFVTPRRKAGI